MGEYAAHMRGGGTDIGHVDGNDDSGCAGVISD